MLSHMNLRILIIDVYNGLKTCVLTTQGSQLLNTTQNRFTEKNAIEKAGLPVATYRLVQNQDQLTEAIAELSFPSVLKRRQVDMMGKDKLF